MMRNLDFRPGDKIKVHYKVKEGEKTRIQPFQGVVISIKGQDIVSKTFTVRHIAVGGVGVERIFSLQSPNIDKIDILEAGNVRRAKLYYLRDRIGKAALKVKIHNVRKPASDEPTKEEPTPRPAGGADSGAVASKE